ncbi:MAG: hypothetical protein JKY51_11520 [Opitutaceae bacterium]|nr:hypothetical protein [Opitutaceae bacterium]
MSNLVMAIQHLLDENDKRGRTPKNLKELADLAGFAPSVLTRLAKNQRCKSDTLTHLIQHISQEVTEKENILTAHLRDEINRSGLDPSSFLIIPTEEAGANPLASIPVHLQETFRILANESLVNDDLQEILMNLGKMISTYHGRSNKTFLYQLSEEKDLRVAEGKVSPVSPDR